MTLATGSTARKTSVRLTPEMTDQIDALATQVGCRPSDVIRTAIELLVDPEAMAAHVARIVSKADASDAVRNAQHSIPDATEGNIGPTPAELT